MARYVVVVDSPSKLIVGGPYLWDGVAEWTPPEQGTLLLESDAAEQGYQWPPDPEPNQP